MNINLIKQIGLLSVLLGLILGVVTVIPIVGLFTFMFVMMFASVLIIYYLKRNEMIGILEPKVAALYGSFIGFLSFIGFSASLIPLAALLGWVNSITLKKLVWFSVVKMLFTMGMGGIFMLVILLFFIALLAALFNAFSGMVAVMVMQKFEKTDELQEEPKLEIEIDE